MNYVETIVCLVIAVIMAICGVRVCGSLRNVLCSPDPDPLLELAPLDILGMPLNIEDLLLQPDVYLG